MRSFVRLVPALLAFGAMLAALASPSKAERVPVLAADEALPDDLRVLLARRGSESTSIGGPNDGSVRGAIAFPARGPGFRWSTVRDPVGRFGTVETVQALVRAALRVTRELPGSEVTVNDLGLERGGPIPHHASHQAGRDVDVLFYLLDANGAPREGVGAPLDPAGEGVDFRDLARADDDVPLRIDAARSWAFVESLLLDDQAPLQRIFLVEHLRTLLLAHARRIRAPRRAIERFEDLTCQPSYPHDDHFHFRFFCTAEDVGAGCHDGAPLYPWHVEAMARLGVQPVPARPRRNRPRAPVTTEAEARASEGPMDPAVTAWLERREAWRPQPHPRRRYCR